MKLLIYLAFAGAMLHAQSTVTITDTIKTPMGGNWSGTVQVTLNNPATAQPLYAGSETLSGWSQTVTVTNGAFSISLYPNDAITPTGTSYTARYTPTSGAGWSETWVCPTGATTIRELRSTTVPTPRTMFTPSQITQAGAALNNVLRWNGSNWAPFASILTDPMTTTGDMIFRTGGVPSRLPIGSTGQVLTVTGGAPAWATNLAGNAATATALQTARTIAGVSFNGTANIAIPSTGLSDSAGLVRGGSALTTAGRYAVTSSSGSLRESVRQVAPLNRPMRAAMSQRAAWVGIGDSNQLFGGYGWHDGMARALELAYGGLWGTGVYPLFNNGNSFWGNGYRANPISTFNLAATGQPAQFDAFMTSLGGNGATPPPTWIANASTSQPGLGFEVDALGSYNTIRWHFTYGQFPGWTGSATPGIRLGASPFWTLATGTAISSSGTAGLVDASLDLPANTAWPGVTLEARLGVPSAVATGEHFLTVQWAEAVERTSGWSYQTLAAQGGVSTRVILQSLNSFGLNSLVEYFRQVRRGLGAQKVVVVGINEGLNDRNDTSASIGPVGGLDSSTQAGFKDNTQGIINLIRAAYAQAGWSTADLYFVLMPSHPVSNPDDAELITYRAAVEEIAETDSNVIVVRIDDFIDSTEMLARGFYQSGGSDVSHLTLAGYNEISERVVNALSKIGNKPAGELFTRQVNATGTVKTDRLQLTGQPIQQAIGTTLASASTIAPVAGITAVSGTTTINTITVPYSGYTGCLKLIPTDAWATGTSGNIQIATTAVVSRVLDMCWNGSKWFPSY